MLCFLDLAPPGPEPPMGHSRYRLAGDICIDAYESGHAGRWPSLRCIWRYLHHLVINLALGS